MLLGNLHFMVKVCVEPKFPVELGVSVTYRWIASPQWVWRLVLKLRREDDLVFINNRGLCSLFFGWLYMVVLLTHLKKNLCLIVQIFGMAEKEMEYRVELFNK